MTISQVDIHPEALAEAEAASHTAKGITHPPGGFGISGSYSKIRIAEAITVVQRPRLSPTPLWVMLVVRTILLEIR